MSSAGASLSRVIRRVPSGDDDCLRNTCTTESGTSDVASSSSMRGLEMSKATRDVIRRVITNSKTDEHFVVMDLENVARKYREWRQKMPLVEPFYAVKCNATASVLRLLADLGSSFDCASKQEISSVLSHGVCPNRIVFGQSCKMASHVTYAAERHVAMMTFDNELELVKVKRLYPAARLILRIVCDDSSALYKVNSQYGASLHDTRHLLTVARQLNLDVIGVSFHVGSGCPEVDAWSVAISNAKRVFEEGAEIGFSFSLLDIGGGFPGETTTRIPFDDICDAVSSALEEHFPADSRVRVIAEPGRYMVGSALTLVVNVIAKRTVFRGNDETGTKEAVNMLYVNDGVFGSFLIKKMGNDIPFPTLLDASQPFLTLLEAVEDEGKRKCRTSIWGPTCAGLDCILADVMMPDVDVGSWLAFENMGAYGVVVGPGFNGFPKPSLYLASDPKKRRRFSEHVSKEAKIKRKRKRRRKAARSPSTATQS